MKDFLFADFSEAFAFMTQAALLAERHNHHPDWQNSYNRVTISLTTHDAGGITEKDTGFAAEVNRLIEAIEKDEWKSVKNLKEYRERFSKIARETLKRDKRVNIRLTGKDLEDIKRKAVHAGIPYQTLISSIIHKYNTGQLTEK